MNIQVALDEAIQEAELTNIEVAQRVGAYVHCSEATVCRWRRSAREPGGRHMVGLINEVPGFLKRIQTMKPKRGRRK